MPQFITYIPAGFVSRAGFVVPLSEKNIKPCGAGLQGLTESVGAAAELLFLREGVINAGKSLVEATEASNVCLFHIKKGVKVSQKSEAVF